MWVDQLLSANLYRRSPELEAQRVPAVTHIDFGRRVGTRVKCSVKASVCVERPSVLPHCQPGPGAPGSLGGNRWHGWI